ncbi:M24 family metallopeptidase [Terriglobus roseus]|uniref:Xaa-Pro dipeptidase n=1 Tax=Terriglobus roseus TaxID=392734 RepID=A0A1H4SZY7_9BACT|nr:Xaa-Pro peptidase family protein [Terriglobus roseus]SEC49638.1 Xaa-Pro dipeptidase [Terriglobus roseus]
MNRRRFLGSTALAAAAAPGFLYGQRPETPAMPTGALPPSIAALKNRRSEAKPITNEERAARVARAKELMAQQGIAGLVMVGSTSLVYFTGIRTGNSERMFAYVIPAKGDAFIVCPYFEEERMRERLTTTPGGDNTRIYTWKEDESPYALVNKGLADLGLRTGKIGVEEKTPYVFANEIAKACPGMQMVDATPVTAGCRMIKSQHELDLMRLANQVTLKVYEAAWKAGHPGMTTEQFSNLMGVAYIQSGFPGFSSCETGIYSALPHGSIKPQVIKENDIVLIDDGCTVEGYPADISRTWVYGKPTDKMLKVFDVVHAAQAAAAAAAKAGNEAQMVDTAARDVITKAGFGPDYKTFTHRLGHGIGMDGHEWTYLVRGNKTILQPNMTFSDEPGIYLKGEFGVRLEDDMIITANGGELFTPQSPSLTQPFGS